VNPKTESVKLRYAAEKGWLNVIDDLDLSAFVFRLGGIYGPGRSAVDTIAKSKSLSRRQKSRESKQYTARIHVADICQAILASMSIRSARFVCLFFIFYFRSSKRLLLFQFFCLQSYFQTSLNLP
jgi:nucleoside-diphosphate-sugar epimerase